MASTSATGPRTPVTGPGHEVTVTGAGHTLPTALPQTGAGYAGRQHLLAGALFALATALAGGLILLSWSPQPAGTHRR